MIKQDIKLDFELNFLNFNKNNWQDCLSESLDFLQLSWNGNWIGLPRVIEKIINWLQTEEFLTKKNLSPDAILMLEIAIHIANSIEKEASEKKVVVDHPYHNRLHFAQVLTSVGIEFSIQAIDSPDENGEWLACLLLSAVGHDYKHTGNVNYRPMEIETRSVEALLPIFVRYDLPDKWCKCIRQIILNTDVPTSRLVHERVKDKLFYWCVDWASVLLIESDNMASVSPKLGPELGVSLANEWLKIESPPDQKVASIDGRRRYLRSLIFSSNASQVLGLSRSVDEQLIFLSQQKVKL
jgi:hypothetical protein